MDGWTTATANNADDNFASDSLPFTRASGSPHGSTGPSAADGAVAGSYYVYTEANGNVPNKAFEMYR